MTKANKDVTHTKNSNDSYLSSSFAASLSTDKKDSLNRLRRRSIAELLDPPVLVNSETTLSKIISMLKQTNSYEVFISLQGKIAALTIRDIIGITDITSARPSLLGKIIPSLRKDTLVGEAARVMSLHRMRTLPVVENNKVVGQISAKRIVKLMNTFSNDSKIRIKASDIMTRKPIVIDSEHTAASAKARMKKTRIDHLPVVDKDRLVGIITSSDIMDLMLPSERIGKKSIGVVNAEYRLHVAVAGILNKEVVTADVQDSIHTVSNKMLSTDSTYCIIKLWDEVQGILTYRDLVALLGEKIQEDIPVFIIGLPDDPLEAELAKSKFGNVVKLLRKIYPDILEARCRIKLKDVTGQRKRYEVDAHIIWTHGNITYTDAGYDLARIFDEMSDALKKRISHKYARKTRKTIREHPPVQ